MYVTYNVDGQDPQEWEWNPAKVRAIEAEAIEDKAGETWDQFQVSLLRGRMRARRVLLWSLLRRTHPDIRLDDVDFTADEVRVEMTKQELVEFRTGLEKIQDQLPESERTAAFTMIDDQLETARDSGDSLGKVS